MTLSGKLLIRALAAKGVTDCEERRGKGRKTSWEAVGVVRERGGWMAA